MANKNTRSLRRYHDIARSLADKYEMEFEESLEMINCIFQDLSDAIEDDTLPKIEITNLGTFQPRISLINRRIRIAFYHYREGRSSREYIVNVIKHLWPVKQRLIKESKYNALTWKEWRHVPRNRSDWDDETMRNINKKY